VSVSQIRSFFGDAPYEDGVDSNQQWYDWHAENLALSVASFEGA